MTFDPSTAIPVDEDPITTDFDPSTAVPVDEARLLGSFDPVTAAPMSRDEEIALVSQYLSPDYVAQSKEEFAQLRKLENDLQAQGAIPSDLENAATAVGGIFVSILNAGGSLLTQPFDSWRRSPATIQSGLGMAALGAMDFGGLTKSVLVGKPKYKTADTGEYVYEPLGGLAPPISTGNENPENLVPMSEDDLLEYDYQQYLADKGIQQETKALETQTAPTEFITSLFTGSRQETPNIDQAKTLGIAADPTNIIPGVAGAKTTLGISRASKLVSSKTARALEKSAIATADKIDDTTQAVVNKVQDITGLTEATQKKVATGIAAGASATGAGSVFLSEADPTTKTALGAGALIFPMLFRYGAATLRNVGTGAGTAKVILRESGDATNGLDQAARASILSNPSIPQVYKDFLRTPSRFRPTESTPARLAADPRLGKQVRAVADRLANPAIVQGVRGTSAIASGAARGTLANVPFAAIAAGADDNEEAYAMLLGGAAFGATGGATSRVTGLRQRRAEARASDTARLLIDVELAGGDVGKLAQTYSPQQLGDLAAMQGFFRDKVEFVPLGKADFDLNTQALGGSGAAGLFVQAPPGEKARIFINLDAKRQGIVPHEIGHALIKSGALGGAQADSIRAFTTRRYTQAGVEARAREYATTLIANENAAKFPGQELPISPDAVQAKMDELGQSGLLRGDTDPLDWARDEIFAEDFRQASQSMDFAAIRRGLPAEGSWLGSMEGILGAQANALSISGVRIDPATGQPDPLFKTNPILATDPLLKKQLGQYLNNYRQWINHPDQTKARGVRVTPAARPQDLANNPLVTFHDYGGGVLANEFATIDPATGQVVLRDQRDINAATVQRQQQIKNLVGSKLLPPNNPALGPKKTADGRVTIRGRTLPQQFDFLNGFPQHQRTFARQLETTGANGESVMVRVHAIGTGDSGSFRVKNLGNLEAITREVIHWGWELTKSNNLNGSLLDLTQFRNRALKAINAGDPTIARLYNNDLKAIEADLKQWMENHRQDLPGSNKIGEQRRDAINSLIGIATNVNKAANPFSGKIAGPGSAIKQFRLDRIDAIAPTGRTGFHFDYDRANNNLLPEIPTPLPNLSTDLPSPKGQAMPDAASKRQEIIKSSLPYYLDRYDPEFAQGMVIYDMMETISLPNGWSLEDRIPSKHGSAYWKITDRLGGNWKLTLRDHPFSPAREKEFGTSDLYSIVGDARNPEQFNSGMTELEEKLLAADRELESITASQNTIAKTAPSLADKIAELRQTLARKEDFFNRGIRIGNGKPFTTDNQRQNALESINQTRAELNEALKKENQSGENLKGAVRSSGLQSVSASETGNAVLSESGLMSTPGQAMLDSVPDKGIDMPAGSMTQLYTTAAKSLPKTVPQAKSVPIVRVMVREKLFDAEGKPVLDKKGKQKEGVTPKLRDNTEIKFKPGDFDLPLPNYQLAKSKFSIGNKDFIGEAVKNRDKVVAAIEQVNRATAVITNDPFKFTDPKGYAEIMRDAGVTKNILVPPSGIDMMLKRPQDFIALLDGGFHGPRTVQGTKAAAMAGLNGVVEMRQVIGEKPTEFVTALHHLWGTLSKQLPPLDQEALWMRLVVQPEVIQQIQNSIDGTFRLKKEQWKSIVERARMATKGEYGKLGNNAASNANSFFLMLKNHNGKWDEVANLYATDSAIDMRSRFNGLGHGATGIKNKVQGFIGLTFGIKGTVLDRWRFVDLYMAPVMQATGAPTHQHYFQYTGDAKRIPEDPIGIYANYGTIENDNPAFSLALYNGIDRAAQAAINASPELKSYLGNHADPGGLHWVTWNAIKNEAVGHSSLDLTKNFLKQFGRTGTAQDWLNLANSSKAYVEGQAANGREIIRLSLDNGVFSYSRQ